MKYLMPQTFINYNYYNGKKGTNYGNHDTILKK